METLYELPCFLHTQLQVSFLPNQSHQLHREQAQNLHVFQVSLLLIVNLVRAISVIRILIHSRENDRPIKDMVTEEANVACLSINLYQLFPYHLVQSIHVKYVREYGLLLKRSLQMLQGIALNLRQRDGTGGKSY